MDEPVTITRVRNFLSLLLDGEPPTGEALIRALDEMALAYHDCPDTEPAEEDRDPPSSDYQALYGELGTRFPDYGYYASADPAEVRQDEATVGDAIDDLADIVSDLREVVWRCENVSVDDALWHFRLLFRTHWGRHLRELSLYLHATVY